MARRITPELMDDPNVDEAALSRSLLFLTRLNRRMGGVGLTRRALQRLAPEAKSLRVLDIGTGAADIPRALVAWGRKHDVDLHLTAVDNHPKTLAAAREATSGYEQIEIVQADGLRLAASEGGPFAPGEFDIVTASLFLHHFDDRAAVGILRQMWRLSRRGMIWNDLWRNPWSRAMTHIATSPAAKIVKHDGRVSIAAGFGLGEARELARQAGWPVPTLHTHLGYRFACVSPAEA